ncbi:MAG: sigma-70 family RNA polymerase sigma factor [Acidiferrobacterales bacterium]
MKPRQPGAERKQRFEVMVQTHSVDLFRYAYWLCSDRVVAEDLVQEVFLRAWKALDSLRDAKAAKSWLLTILWRENARRFERYQPDWEDVELDGLEDRETPYETRTEAFALRQAIAALPAAYREPLLLQVLGRYSTEEIAEFLGLSKGAVLSRVFRARAKLRAAIVDDE